MDFETFDLENLNTKNLSVDLSYDKRKKLKTLIIDLINEGQKLVKETENKCPPTQPTVVVKNVRKVPKGMTITHVKTPKPEKLKPQINVKCGICKTRFKSLSLLSEHSKSCKPINLESERELPMVPDDQKLPNKKLSTGTQISFKCGICSSYFKSLELLSDHSAGCKKVSLDVEEDIFDEIADDDYNDIHFGDDEVQTQIDLICEICNSHFETLDLLSQHSEGCKAIEKDVFQAIKENRTLPRKIIKPITPVQYAFECEICKCEFETLNKLSKHSAECKTKKLEMDVCEDIKDTDESVAISTFRCVLCKLQFKNTKALFMHSKSCNKLARNPISMEISVNKAQDTKQDSIKLLRLNTGKYLCSICKKVFITRKAGLLHLSGHYPNLKFVRRKGGKVINEKSKTVECQVKTIVYKCSTCFKEFQFYSTLAKHKLIHKQERKETNESNEQLETTYGLKQKLEKLKDSKKNSMDIKVRTRWCQICEKKFIRKEFNKHVEEEHKSVETFPCKACDKIAFTKVAFDSHMILAHPRLMKTKYPCEKCDIAPFGKQHMLDTHMRRKHSDVVKIIKTNICETCGKSFSDVSGKERHIKFVHGPDIGFVCEYCGKGFKTDDRNSHYRTHTGERPFECDECDSKFRYSHDLVVHKRLHSGLRPFECTICHQRFIANTNLHKHLKSRHLVSTGIAVE